MDPNDEGDNPFFVHVRSSDPEDTAQRVWQYKYNRMRQKLLVLINTTDAVRSSMTTDKLSDNEIQFFVPPSNPLADNVWKHRTPTSVPSSLCYVVDRSAVNTVAAINKLIRKIIKAGDKIIEIENDIIARKHGIRIRENMKLQTFKPLLETDEEDDPFDSRHITSIAKWSSSDRLAQQLEARIQKYRARAVKLYQEYADRFIFSTAQKMNAVAGGRFKDDDFQIVTIDNSTYYVLKNGNPTVVTKFKKIGRSISQDKNIFSTIPDEKKKHLHPAAQEYTVNQKQKPKTVLQPHEINEGIRYWDENNKQRWLHNPASPGFGDDPKYAGSIEHYDWHQVGKKLMSEYFLLSNWLESIGTPFQKMFAAEHEGKPWIVAIAANHGLIWHVLDGRSQVYVRAQNPTTVANVIEKPQLFTNTVKASADLLDPTGKVMPIGSQTPPKQP